MSETKGDGKQKQSGERENEIEREGGGTREGDRDRQRREIKNRWIERQTDKHRERQSEERGIKREGQEMMDNIETGGQREIQTERGR